MPPTLPTVSFVEAIEREVEYCEPTMGVWPLIRGDGWCGEHQLSHPE
jgi:hypothetical protein